MAPITPSAADLSRAEEDAAIAHITDDLKAVVEKLYPPGTRPMRRDAHPKAHGAVVARFSVNADVPAALRHGVFAAPKEFTAWVRFSNSAPKVQHDLKPDVRGFAIKLLGVDGPKLLDDERDAQTQDFILASAPMFFVRNPLEYVPFSDAVKSNHPFTGAVPARAERGQVSRAAAHPAGRRLVWIQCRLSASQHGGVAARASRDVRLHDPASGRSAGDADRRSGDQMG
jgi:hypothetical protein